MEWDRQTLGLVDLRLHSSYVFWTKIMFFALVIGLVLKPQTMRNTIVEWHCSTIGLVIFFLTVMFNKCLKSRVWIHKWPKSFSKNTAFTLHPEYVAVLPNIASKSTVHNPDYRQVLKVPRKLNIYVSEINVSVDWFTNESQCSWEIVFFLKRLSLSSEP